MKEHGSCHGHGGPDASFRFAILVMTAGRRELCSLSLLFQLVLACCRSESTAIVRHTFLNHHSIVFGWVLEILHCLESLAGIQVSLELNVNESRAGIDEDATTFAPIMALAKS